MLIEIVLNGNIESTESGINITNLLFTKKVASPEMVSIELNGNILDKEDYNSTILTAGDQLELLYFMGGGK